TVAEAYALEKRVQGWSRAKREALIRGEYHLLPGLSRRGSTGGDDRAAGRRPGGEDAPAGRVPGGETPRRSSAGRSPGYRDRGVSIRRFAATQPTATGALRLLNRLGGSAAATRPAGWGRCGYSTGWVGALRLLKRLGGRAGAVSAWLDYSGESRSNGRDVSRETPRGIRDHPQPLRC